MVRIIFILSFLQFYIACNAQKFNEIQLKISFSRCTVLMEDTLKIYLDYVNCTNDSIIFYPDAIIGLVHNNNNAFIFPNKETRILYKLNNTSNHSNSVKMKPNEQFRDTFDLKADNLFFYKGNNNIQLFYHFYKDDKQKKHHNKPTLSIWSQVVTLIIE